MIPEIERIQASLDAGDAPIVFFFRNDDGGWAESALFHLLEIAAAHGAVIDLATIPSAMTAGQARRLSSFARTTRAVRIHQHGYMHHNHEPAGKKCEFGASRSMARQWLDIKLGKARLADFFPGSVDPIFTPPWNRCAQTTVDALQMEGFAALSRDDTAETLDLLGLSDVSINADWCAPSPDRTRYALGGAGRVANLVDEGASRIGVMTHHETMGDELRASFDAMLNILAGHPRVTFSTMLSYAQPTSALADFG